MLYDERVQTFLESPEHGVPKNVCTRSSYIDYGVGKPSGIGPMRSKHVYSERLIGRTSPRHRRVTIPPTFDHAPRTKRRGVSRACARCVPLPTAETASSTCVDAQIGDGCAELHDCRASRSRSRLGHICARHVTERVPIVFALRGELARWQHIEDVNKAFERVVSPSM